MNVTELTVGWTLLTVVVLLISSRFLFLYAKDRDRRKLMFGCTYAIGAVAFILLALGYDMNTGNVYINNFYHWASIPNTIAIAIAVNEGVFGARYFSRMFKGLVIFSLLTLPLIFLPTYFDFVWILRYILAANTVLALIYLLIKHRSLPSVFFMTAIAFFTVAGMNLANGLQYISIIAFLLGYASLAVIFIPRPKALSAPEKGIEPYFTIQNRLARAEAALQDSRERFRTIFENSYDAILYIDRQGNITDANRRIESITGFNREEIVDRHFTKAGFLKQKGIPSAIREFGQVIGGKGHHIVEVEAVSKDGREICLESSCQLIQQDGQPQGIVCIIREITERRQAEEELIQRAKFIQDSPNPLLRLARDGTIVYANESSQPLLDLWATRAGEPAPEGICQLVTDVLNDGSCNDTEVEYGDRLFSLALLPAMGQEQVNLYGRDVTERRQAEDQYRLLAEHSADIICRIQMDGSFTYISPSVERLLGYTIQEVHPLNLSDVLTQESFAYQRDRMLQDIQAGRSTGTVELEAIHKDGRIIPIESNACIMFDENRQPQEIICAVRNITERKRAEARIDHLNRTLRSIRDINRLIARAGDHSNLLRGVCDHLVARQSCLTAWIALMDESGLVTDCAGAGLGNDFTNSLKTIKRELLPCFRRARQHTRVTMMEDTGRCEGCFAASVNANRGRLSMQLEHEGHCYGILCAAIPNDTASTKEEMNLFKGVAQDIALGLYRLELEELRNQAEQALRENEEFSHSLLENSPFPISVVHPDTRIKYVNPAFENLTGFTLAELADTKAPFPWWPEDHKARRMAGLTEFMFGGDVISKQPIRTKDGEDLMIELNMVRVMHDGEFKYYLAQWNDVTERTRFRKELELTMERLQRSNADLEQFAYIASHDLQEPLRMVSSYVQLLAQRYKDKLDSDADDFINYAVEGTARMRNLINDLLAFSRVGTRGKPLEPTDCNEAAALALENLNLAIAEKGAEVTCDPLPKVKADNSQLVELFQNLVGNAIKFRGDEPPHVHISAEEKEGVWEFCVRDNGIGIDPEHFDRIFKIFQRLNNRADYPGTGIGLAICKRIVERHGGKIWAESEPGHGTAFYFSIPQIQEVKVYA